MLFSEKLDFLMTITRTSNSTLAHYIKLDASHISRLRRGQRGALKDNACLHRMGVYFARHSEEDYQQKTILDTLKITSSHWDSEKMAAALAQWLATERATGEPDVIGGFLSDFAQTDNRQTWPVFDLSPQEESVPVGSITLLYGVEGKRQAVRRFLSDVLTQKEPLTLLLFSDEATDWMTTDPRFAMEWASLMFQVLNQGHKIKIIHTISRNLDEMLNAISQWMPLYMTGGIEPYFYPKKRDGIFKQTLFIARNHSAVISRSVGDTHRQAVNFYIEEVQAVKAFEDEFRQYLELCQPLMKIYTAKDRTSYFDQLLKFEAAKSNVIVKTESLSASSLPETAAAHLLARQKENRRTILHYQRQRHDLFKLLLKTNRFSEVICLPDIEQVLASNVKVAFSDMLNGGALYYTPQEYLLHLTHLVELLRTRKNFNVCLIPAVGENRYAIYAKENFGAIVAKTSAPPIILVMHESNMAAAFWDHLTHLVGESVYRNPRNAATVKKLLAYIQRLQEALEGK